MTKSLKKILTLLISKGFFVVFNSSKNKRKQVDLRYHSTVGRIFSFVFWKNSGYQHVISKLTDLYQLFALENLVCHCTIVKSSKKRRKALLVTSQLIKMKYCFVERVKSFINQGRKSVKNICGGQA